MSSGKEIGIYLKVLGLRGLLKAINRIVELANKVLLVGNLETGRLTHED